MIIKLDSLLTFAISQNATDIHIETTNKKISYMLRTPLGFIEYDYHEHDLLHHIKYMSHLDLWTHNKPQTGVFEYIINEQAYYFRVAVIKTFMIESCVIRILNPSYIREDIGTKKDQDTFRKIINLNNGLVIFSGATGSGKTTTMYHLLNKFKNKKIYTIEDPVEVYLDNIVQTSVNISLNYDYGQGIKQLLRHDPDVIVIGEIRDEVAAKMAVRAALTGHLVIATLHATSLKQVKSRLLDLNVNEGFLKDCLVFSSYQKMLIENNRRLVKFKYEWC